MKPLNEFSDPSRAANAKTFAELESNADYVHCPQCKGVGMLYAHWDEEHPTWGEYVPCPCCFGTKLASPPSALEWLEAEEDRKGWSE